MKYAFNTWAYSSFPCWVPAYPLEYVIEKLSDIGYDGIELGCAQPHAWPYFMDAERRKQIKGLLEESNIVVSSVLPCPGGGPGGNIASACEAERRWAVQYLKDCCDLAVDLESKTLLCVAGWYIFGTKRTDAWANSLSRIKEIGKYCGDRGVTLVIEPTAEDSNLVECCDDALEMADQSGLDNVAVMFDTAHTAYRNEPSTDYIYTMDKRMKHIHLTDYNRTAPGTSGMDFTPIMQAIKDVGFDGYLTMETGFPRRSAHPDSVARMSLEHLRAIEKALK